VSTRRGGLGRGLGALLPSSPPPTRGAVAEAIEDERPTASTSTDGLPDDGATALTPVPGARLAEIPVAAIEANPQQPRQVFDEESLEELAASIREVGVLQPVVVRELGDDRYQLVMGERRWRAVQRAGLATVPAIVRDTDDTALLRDALLENLHRQQLNPLEEAAAYQQLLDEFGATHEELGQRIGRSRPQISNTLRLLNLPAAVQKRVAAGVLSAGHARALLALDDADAQDRLAHRIVAEGLSVRAVEEIVAMGGDGAPARSRARRTKAHAPGLAELASQLSDRFETRVKVELGRSKGKIVVEFASLDDLERIVAAMTDSALAVPQDAEPA
jgi:ParB family transcriptional regulator, chromosome partitioning protein